MNEDMGCLGCAATVGIVVGTLVINLAFLALCVWVVITVAQAMGVV